MLMQGLLLEDKIVNLVENLPDYQHGITLQKSYMADEMFKRLKKRGYYGNYEYDLILLSKHEKFIDTIYYHSSAVMSVSKNLFICVSLLNGVVISVSSEILTANQAQSIVAMNAFIGYDDVSETIPELWVKVIRSFYGKVIPVRVTYDFRIEKHEQKQRQYYPEDLTVNKLA